MKSEKFTRSPKVLQLVLGVTYICERDLHLTGKITFWSFYNISCVMTLKGLKTLMSSITALTAPISTHDFSSKRRPQRLKKILETLIMKSTAEVSPGKKSLFLIDFCKYL